MKMATLRQGNQVVNLILQKEVPAEQLQRLMESGLLADLLDANVEMTDRAKFLCVIGMPLRAAELMGRKRQSVPDLSGQCPECKVFTWVGKHPLHEQEIELQYIILPHLHPEGYSSPETGVTCIGTGRVPTWIGSGKLIDPTV